MSIEVSFESKCAFDAYRAETDGEGLERATCLSYASFARSRN